MPLVSNVEMKLFLIISIIGYDMVRSGHVDVVVHLQHARVVVDE